MKEPAHSPRQAALQVIRALRDGGHRAYLAGGCVRDMLLNLTPKDYDVATDAPPDRVRELFPRARLVGAKFGVVLVRRSKHDIEVATFRCDGPYTDGRRPDRVTFATEVEDAHRRDFTINGLFYDPMGDRVIDYVGGRTDLAARIIRTIGDPDQRFAEDHLRMLRAVRLATRLGFTIEPSTAEAIRRLAPNLRAISAERIWQELEKVLTGPARAAGWSLIVTLGLCEHLAPAWPQDPQHLPRIEGRLAALPAESIDAPLAVAVLLCDGTMETATRVCRGLRLSNRLTEAVGWLVRSLPMLRGEASLQLADLKLLMADASWPQLLELLRVDLLARGEDIALHETVRRRAAAIAPHDIAPPPLLTGDELAAMGMSTGFRFGEILRTVYRAQLNEEISTRERAWAMARELMAG